MRTRLEHRRDIQGLRAVAVLLVIGDHAGVGWLSGGFVGVDVFFVISGYLITLLLVREAASTGRVRIGEFYARRARRILPAATLVILVTTAYAASHLSLVRVQQLREDAVWSALFGANVHLARLGIDYFDQGREPSPFEHFWSLAVEEQFYLVWPLLVAVTLVVVTRNGATCASRTNALTWLLAVVIAASLACSLLQTSATPGPAYYSSPARAWELAVGALVAVRQPQLAALGRRFRVGLGLFGLVAVTTAAVGYGVGSAFPGWRALLPVLGAAALVAGGPGGTAWPNSLLTLAPLPWVGDLSFSLYLWHWPLLALGPTYSDRLVGVRGTSFLLLATLGAAFVTYRLVEDPIRRSRVLRPGRRSLALWPVALGAVVLSTAGAEQEATGALHERMAGSADGAPGSSNATTDASARPPAGGEGGPEASAGPGRRSLGERLVEALRAADSGAPIPFPLTNLPHPPEDAFRLPPSCIVDPEETSTNICPVGRPDARRTMVVLGDSQAGQWMPALDRLGRTEGFTVLPLIKLGCTPFDVPMVDGGGADFWQCTAFREWAATQIRDARPDLVVVGSEATSDRMYPSPGLSLDQTWAAGVSNLLDRLQGQGARVVLLADTPDFSFDPVDCLTDPDSNLGSCVGTPHQGLAEANAATRHVAADLGAGFVDTLALLCRQGRCPLVVDRTMTFMDYSHVSAAWASALADDFARLYRRARSDLRDAPS